MPSFVPPEKNIAYTFYVGLVSQSNTKLLQADPTIVGGDVKVAADDANPANLSTVPVVDADFTKRVKIVLTASEMNGDNITVIFSDAAGAEWADLIINFQTVARQLDDLTFPATAGRSITVETDGHVHADVREWLGGAPSALNSGKVQSDVQRWVNAVPNALNSGTVQADVQRWLNAVPSALISGRVDVTAILQAAGVDAIWDEDIVAAHGAADTTGLLLRALGALISKRSNNPTLDAVLGVADSAGNDVPAQILTGEVLAELVAAVPDATPTLAKAIMLFYMMTRNKLTVTATLMQIFSDAGLVVVKKVLDDDGTTYTETEAVAGP